MGMARGVLKGAPIVVLDEPTSAMDAHTERLVMAGIARLLRNRTGFIIAHRLATVMKADRVVVLDEGRIVESGAPGRLLADSGSRFASLARAQLISGPDDDALSTGRHARMAARGETMPLRPDRRHAAAGHDSTSWAQNSAPGQGASLPSQPRGNGSSQRPAHWQRGFDNGADPSPLSRPIALEDAVQAGYAEGFGLGAAVARDAPAQWLEAVIARKPQMPSGLQTRPVQGSHLPLETLLDDDVKHALPCGV